MTNKFIQNIVNEIKPQKREKLEEELSPNEELEHLWEMATVGRQDACKGLKNGMRLEIITSEYKNTGEEKHLHLFPASHRDRTGKANNYDLITRVKITDEPPQSPSDIVAIKDNPDVPEEYQIAIFEWSKGKTKHGTNNWRHILDVWDDMNS